MTRKRKNHDLDTATGVICIPIALAVFGWFDAARTFVLDRLPLFAALVTAVLLLVLLVVTRRIATARRRAGRQRALDMQVATTDGMTGADFERLVARLMERDGFTGVRIPGGPGDLGADVLGTGPDGTTVVVQCKRYAQARKVSSPDMQKFLGTCFHEHNADSAWFVTTTTFSMAARDLGYRRGVTLIERRDLAEWMATVPNTLEEAQPPAPPATGENAVRVRRASARSGGGRA